MELDIKKSRTNLVLRETHSGNLEAVKAYQNDFPGLQWSAVAYDETGDTIMHVAARLGHIDIIHYLLKNFQSNTIDYRNRDGKTILHEAAQFAQPEVVHLLVKRGADPNALKRSDWTPLMLACTKINKAEDKKNNLKCVDMLIKYGAIVNYRNKDGWTALHLICREGSLDILKLLISHGADVNFKTNNGRTGLHIAALHSNLEIAEYLISSGLEINATDSSGNTALHESAIGGNLKLVVLLLNNGADPMTINKSGFGVLHLAASTGQIHIIEFFIKELKTDNNIKSYTKLTPLHCAARHNKKEAYAVLLELGARQDVKDIFGRCPREYFNLKKS